MTCIAWDGKTLAADKRASYGNLVRTVTKIRRVGDMLVAIAGHASIGEEMVAWIERGADPATFPASARAKEEGANILVIKDGVAMEYERTPHPVIYEDKFMAIGCGRDFAIAAMHLGRTAQEAVAIACKFDSGCGNGIDTLELE